MANSIPIAILTGFLGSGKSTILNAVVRDPEMAGSAVIINEFGDVAIDHVLVEDVVEGVAILSSGCVCCAVRTDLEATLRDLHLKQIRGLIPPFQRAIIETSGLAEPAPLLQTILSSGSRGLGHALGPVVTIVDTIYGMDTLDRFNESLRQVAAADRLVLTKLDLQEADDSLRQRLTALNPTALLLALEPRERTPRAIFGDGFVDLRAAPPLRHDLAEADPGHVHSPMRSRCFRFPELMQWDEVDGRLRALLDAFGDRILRLKGVLAIEHVPGAVVVQAVRHEFYPPVTLPAWPFPDPGSRLVVIYEQDNADPALGRALDELGNAFAAAPA